MKCSSPLVISTPPFLPEILIIHLLLLSLTTGHVLANCWTEQAKDVQNENDFVLECTDSGGYKPLQCDKKTGYCFCVNEQTGKPNFGSTARPISHLLDCTKQPSHSGGGTSSSSHDPGYRRRRPKESPKSRGTRGDRCNPTQRISQINFLIGTFRADLEAAKKSSTTTTQHRPPTDWNLPIIGIRRSRRSSQNAVEWKFTNLDTNGDTRLSTEEMLPLVEYSREKMKSVHGCANSLILYCDTNKDSTVDWEEFAYCFNTANAVQLQNLLKNARRKNPKNPVRFVQPQPSRTQIAPSSSPPPPPPPQPTSPISYSSILLQNPVNSQATANASTVLASRLDCNATRDNLLETAHEEEEAATRGRNSGSRHRGGRGGIVSTSAAAHFIPKCTADGYYETIQCTAAGGDSEVLCWCVNRVTGATVKQIKANSTTPSPALCEAIRQGKGCDSRRRTKFHTELRSLLLRENQSCDSVFGAVLDLNHDLAVDGKEWKHFKKSRRAKINSRLRKCFRTEIAFCDQDGDSLISHGEWIRCCSAATTSEETGGGTGRRKDPGRGVPALNSAGLYRTSPTASPDGGSSYREKMKLKRPRGRNPFTAILRP